MLTLCEEDKNNIQRFRAYLLTLFPKEKADEYVTHIRDVLEEQNMTSLADLLGYEESLSQVDALWCLIDHYRGDPKEEALRRYGDFLWPDEIIDPANQTFISKHFKNRLPTGLEVILREKEIKLGDDRIGLCLGAYRSAKLSVMPAYKIAFRLRKKKKSDWLEETLDFIEKNLADDYKNELKKLHHLIAGALAADDNHADESDIRAQLHRVLYIVRWGFKPEEEFEYVLTAGLGLEEPRDRGITRKAGCLLDELKTEKDPLIEVLSGEYIEGDPKSDVSGTIVLYLSNILDFAKDHGFDEMACVQSAFAHQYFIFHYCAFFRAKMKARRLKKLPKGFDDFFPGKIVRESLASYFECYVDEDEGCDFFWGGHPSPNTPLAEYIKRSWSKESVTSHPEVGAKNIRDEKHFEEILNKALNLPDGLFYAAYELLK